MALFAHWLAMLLMGSSISLPWTFPGDFRDRLRMSDLVVSGTIEDTSALGVQIVDHTELTANVAHVLVDRVFQGPDIGELQFTWFTFHFPTGEGFVYSGSPLANFRPNERYLIFLKRTASGWVVAMPLYAVEMALAPAPPPHVLRNFSEVTAQLRYEALAEELETAALLVPTPQPGLTGEAAGYFPSVFDLLGGCAEPFYRQFLSSYSPELRGAAFNWLSLIRSRRLICKGRVPLMLQE